MDLGTNRSVPRPHFPLATGSNGEVAARFRAEELAATIAATRDWLVVRQHGDGYWCGQVNGAASLQADYLLLLAFLSREHSPRAKKLAASIHEMQLSEGGWAAYPGGPLEISGSVRAYLALKLTGHRSEAEPMQRARRAIRAAGGAGAIDTATEFYLALFSQLPYDRCRAVPPELILLPTWSPLNIYRSSAWSRTIAVPLSIVWALRPQRVVSPDRGISELLLEPAAPLVPDNGSQGRWFSQDGFFDRANHALKWLERRRWHPFRERGLAAAKQWMTTRFSHSDGLFAVAGSIIWSVIALKALGYSDESVELRYNFDQLDALLIESNDSARLQPCLSPVQDSAQTLSALAAAGLTLDEPLMTSAVDWLLDKEVTRPGDWATHVSAAPGGWYLQHHNEFYPNVADTASVMIALRELVSRSEGRSSPASAQPAAPVPRWEKTSTQERAVFSRQRWLHGACERARRWILAMQNRDGGWGTFDKDMHRSMTGNPSVASLDLRNDASAPDITGRVIEALARWGAKPENPQLQRAIAFLRKTQQPDGSWLGRSGVSYIYGTWQSLAGLAAAGIAADDSAIKNGARWLIDHQQACGGWGESPASYERPEMRGRGPVTASQTAWAILGLIAAGLASHPSVERGVSYLIDTQARDGSWRELQFTAAGFGSTVYTKRQYYAMYFPLLALTQFETKRTATAAAVKSETGTATTLAAK